MKRFISAIVSLVLAGSMTLGLAACGGNGNQNENKDPYQPPNGNQEQALTAEEWAKAFENFDALENFTATEAYGMEAGIKYNGEYITADTVIGEGATGADLFGMLGINENPMQNVRETTNKYDYANGIVELSNYNYILKDYVQAVGTTINRYIGRSDNYSKTTYTGYASAEQAIEVVKQQNKYSLHSGVKFYGTGENSDKSGTIAELYDLFTYDEVEDTYSAILALDGMEDVGVPVEGYKISVKIANDAVSYFQTKLSAENISFADYIDNLVGSQLPESYIEMLKDFTLDMSEFEYVTISDVGTTVVTLPSDIEELTQSTRTAKLLNEETYKSMFDRLFIDEGTVSLAAYKYDSDKNVATDYKYYYNPELGLLKVTTEVNDHEVSDNSYKDTKLYWAKDGKLTIFTAEYDGFYFKKWSDVVETETILGDVTAALAAKLPAEVQVFFNLNGKPMMESFDCFTNEGYVNPVAKTTVDGEEVRIVPDYSYSENKDNFYLSGYYFGDVYVTLDNGYILSANEGLPEVECIPVTEVEWKSLVEPWYNLNNVTITDSEGTLFVDIANDGKSGTLAYFGRREQYVQFEEVADSVYTVYRYVSGNYRDEETGESVFKWVKHISTAYSLRQVFNQIYSDTYIFDMFGDEVFYDDDSASKKIGDMWAKVGFNPLIDAYELTPDTYSYYSLSFSGGNLKVKYNGTSKTLSDRGTTTAKVPDYVLEAVK